ncbi:MAG: hypothetical protein ABSA84_01060 [Gammaproteobacteria bacterium]
MSGETPEQQEQKKLQQNANGLLKEALKNHNRLYTKFGKKDDPLTNEYLDNLIKILQEENELNATLKAKGWMEWGKAFVKTDLDYAKANQRNSELAQKKQTLITEYVEKTKLESAKELAEQIQINTKETPIISLQQPLIKQIELSEIQIHTLPQIIDAFGKEMPNLATKPLDYDKKAAEITEEYRKALMDQGIMEQFVAKQFDSYQTLKNKYPAQIQPLIAKLAQSYAQYMFIKAEQSIPRGDTSDDFPVNREELAKLALQAEQDKDSDLTKIMLFCEYSKDTKYMKDVNDPSTINIDLLIQDIEKISPQDIKNWSQQAKDIFYKTPGSYMLSEPEQQQFIKQLFILEARIAANHSAKKEKQALQNQITSAMEQAAKRYNDKYTRETPDNALKPLVEWNTGNESDNQQQRILKAREAANKQFHEIKGSNFLDASDKARFINMLSVLKEKEMLEQNKQYAVTKWFWPYEELTIEACTKEIDTKTHTYFKEKDETIKKRIKDFETTFNIAEITLEPLCSILKEQLSNVIINKRKETFGVKPLPDTDTDLNRVLNRIEIAKVLSTIEQFKSVPADTQLKYIENLTDILEKINTLNDKLIQAKEDAQTVAAKQTDVKNLEHQIQQQNQLISQIIDDIVFNPFNKDKDALNIAENKLNDTISNWWDKTKAFFKLDKTKGVIAGALFGVVAYLSLAGNSMLAPIIGKFSGIPFLGTAVNAISAFSAFSSPLGLTIAAMAGAAIGYPFSKIGHVFTPFTYLYNEVADIITKPKSYIDRFFRGAAILTSTLGMAVGIGFLVTLAANPFSGPVVAGVIVGGLATVLVAAATARVAKLISTQVSKRYNNGMIDVDLFIPTEKAKQRLDGEPNAKIVSEYFMQEKKQIEDQMSKSNITEFELKLLEQKLGDLMNTWNNIQQGKTASWAPIARKLFEEKMEIQAQKAKKIDVSDVTNTLLERITAPKHEPSGPDPLAPIRIMDQPKRQHLSFTKQQAIVKELEQDMQKLREVNAIIKKDH